MTNKRFLSSVLAFVAVGVSGRAAVVSYCDGATNTTCTDNSAAFSNAGLLAIDFTSASVVSNSFTDPNSGTVLGDNAGGTITEASDALADSKNGFQITLPTNTMVLALDYQVPIGTSFTVQFTSASSTYVYSFTSSSSSLPVFFAATSDQPITGLNTYGYPANPATITNFELQGAGDMSDTPEVGTLLLIGSGLIAMRWMGRAKSHFLRTLRPA